MSRVVSNQCIVFVITFDCPVYLLIYFLSVTARRIVGVGQRSFSFPIICFTNSSSNASVKALSNKGLGPGIRGGITNELHTLSVFWNIFYLTLKHHFRHHEIYHVTYKYFLDQINFMKLWYLSVHWYHILDTITNMCPKS